MTLAKSIPAFGLMGIIIGINIEFSGFFLRPRRWWFKQQRIEDRSQESNLYLGPKGKKRTKRGHYGDFWMRGNGVRSGLARTLQWQENLEEDFLTSMVEPYNQDQSHYQQIGNRYAIERPELTAANVRKLKARARFAGHNQQILQSAEFKAWLAQQDKLEAAAAL